MQCLGRVCFSKEESEVSSSSFDRPIWGLAGSVARIYLGVSSSSSRCVTNPVQLCKRMGWVSVSIPSKRLAILSFLFISKNSLLFGSKIFLNSATLGSAVKTLALILLLQLASCSLSSSKNSF